MARRRVRRTAVSVGGAVVLAASSWWAPAPLGPLPPTHSVRGGTVSGPWPVVVATPAPSAAAPRPRPRDPVGPLFAAGLGSPHSCTGSVVASPSGEVLLTAAHCLSGTGAGIVFAPGYHDGVAPHGTWVVQGAYASPRWLTAQDPLADYAFLRLRPSPANPTAAPVESVVGANRLATAPRAGGKVVVTGYGYGTGGRAIRCGATVSLTGPYPTFDCPGFVAGTSGGPWVSGADDDARAGQVVGVIGGLHQGGCFDDTSYSAPFDADTLAAYERAVVADAPDVLPAPGGEDC